MNGRLFECRGRRAGRTRGYVRVILPPLWSLAQALTTVCAPCTPNKARRIPARSSETAILRSAGNYLYTIVGEGNIYRSHGWLAGQRGTPVRPSDRFVSLTA